MKLETTGKGPNIVSEADWLVARKRLLAKEKEFHPADHRALSHQAQLRDNRLPQIPGRKSHA